MNITNTPDWKIVKVWGDAQKEDLFRLGRPLEIKYFEFDQKKCEKFDIPYQEGRFLGVEASDCPPNAVTRDKHNIGHVDYSQLVPNLLIRVAELEKKVGRPRF